MWGDIATTFLLAFITAFVITPFSIKLAKKIGAIDNPNDRRVNKNPTPRLGGIAIIAAFLVASIYLIISMTLEKKFDLFDYNHYGKKLLGFLIGIIVLGIVSLIDDAKDIKPWIKLIAQFIVATSTYFFGIRIDEILGFQLNPIMNYIITVSWILLITNSINLIDGLDGLSSGLTIISAFSLLIIVATNGSLPLAIVLITALIGSIVGFLPYNVNPAKTFVGDIGSQFFGYSLAVISIFGVAKTFTLLVLIAPILILGLPIVDTIMAIFRRTKKEKSLKAIFKADKDHMHHRLVEYGFTQKQAVTILYVISGLLRTICYYFDL